MEEYEIWEKENLKILKKYIKDEKNGKELKELLKSAFKCGYNSGYITKDKEIAKKKWDEWNQK